MPKSFDVQPIKTHNSAIMLEERLWQIHRPYSILFSLLIGTGAPLQYLLPLKVEDIYWNQEITFKLRSDSPRFITTRIPDHTMRIITDTYTGADQDSYAFPSISGKGHVTMDEFKKRLSRTSIELDFPQPGLSLASLSKTYVYRKFLETGKPDEPLYYLGWRSANRLYKYLGITKVKLTPQKNTGQTIYDDTIIANLLSNTIDMLIKTRVDIVDNHNVDKYNAHGVITLCSGISNLVEDYNRDYRP